LPLKKTRFPAEKLTIVEIAAKQVIIRLAAANGNKFPFNSKYTFSGRICGRNLSTKQALLRV
jgi:hypothetical protein